MMRSFVALGLAAIAVACAILLGDRARSWNDELALASPPLAREAPRLDDPKTPRLTGRVVLIIIDGLGIDEARLPYLEELGARGVSTSARVPYPTISRPNYVTILTGVPPRDSGVRANRVRTPVGIDTVMDRVRAAGLVVATASDFGMLPSLFLRNTPVLGVAMIEQGSRVSPRPPITWPVDEARRVASLDELGPMIATLAAGAAAFVPVLVLDVDRAGHGDGIGPEYRAAAHAVDRMLRVAFASLDLERDTVIITADHGHVAPGGHGGDEREVSNVPLVLAGKGIVRGAVAHDARLIDVAPTIAALLGVPAPGHAEGRALVELLQLAPEEATRRVFADTRRAGFIAGVVDVHGGLQPARLVVLGLVLALAFGLTMLLRHRAAIALAPGMLAGGLGFVVMLVAVVIITRGHLSPSYIPSLPRTELFGAIGAGVAIASQLVASWSVIRRASDRVAAANGVALVGLALGITSVALVRAWFSPPYLDVPSPFWMVAVPALDLAAATCALGALLALGLAAITRRRRRPADSRSRDDHRA